MGRKCIGLQLAESADLSSKPILCQTQIHPYKYFYTLYDIARTFFLDLLDIVVQEQV
jgi:hypothetical protein